MTTTTNLYEVTFGNPRKEQTWTFAVMAQSKEDAERIAKRDALRAGVMARVSSVRKVTQ